MEKTKIYEFDPVIYPFRLYVAVMPTFDECDSRFYFLDYDDEVVDDAEKEFTRSSSSIATTFVVSNREDGWKGCLVAIWKRSQCGAGVCAHEATHVYDYVDNSLGLNCNTFASGEPKAYLVQWITNQIYSVLKGKTK